MCLRFCSTFNSELELRSRAKMCFVLAEMAASTSSKRPIWHSRSIDIMTHERPPWCHNNFDLDACSMRYEQHSNRQHTGLRCRNNYTLIVILTFNYNPESIANFRTRNKWTQNNHRATVKRQIGFLYFNLNNALKTTTIHFTNKIVKT